MSALRALGIDPSLTSTGVVILKDGELEYVGVIKTTTDDSMGDRLARIQCAIDRVIRCNPALHIAAVEDPAHARNTSIANKLGAAWGAALTACSLARLDPHSVKVTEHRKAWGTQSKAEAVALIRTRWPELMRYPDDAADAASVAWWASERLACAIADQADQ